jgi:hypothetical protein
MTVYVTEYGGYVGARPFAPGVPIGAPIQSQTLTTGVSYSLSSATKLVMVSADAGSWLFLGSSLSTGVASTAQTSTNPLGACTRVPAGVAPFPIIVLPYMRLLTNST